MPPRGPRGLTHSDREDDGSGPAPTKPCVAQGSTSANLPWVTYATYPGELRGEVAQEMAARAMYTGRGRWGPTYHRYRVDQIPDWKIRFFNRL